MGAGLDKWPYIWATVGPAGRLNMFWSRPNRLWWPTSFATRNNTNTKYILQIHNWTQIQIHFKQKSFTILRRQLFCLFSNTLSIAVAECATVAYKWISYSDRFPDSRDLTKVIEIAQQWLRRWDHPFKCVFQLHPETWIWWKWNKLFCNSKSIKVCTVPFCNQDNNFCHNSS